MTLAQIPLSEVPDSYFAEQEWDRLLQLCQGSRQRAFVILERWCMPESHIPVEIEFAREHQGQQADDFRESVRLGRKLIAGFRRTMIQGDFEGTTTMPGTPALPLAPDIWNTAHLDFETNRMKLGRTEYHSVHVRQKVIQQKTAQEQCRMFLQNAKAERPAQKKTHLRIELRALCPTLTDDEFNLIYKDVFRTTRGRRKVNTI